MGKHTFISNYNKLFKRNFSFCDEYCKKHSLQWKLPNVTTCLFSLSVKWSNIILYALYFTFKEFKIFVEQEPRSSFANESKTFESKFSYLRGCFFRRPFDEAPKSTHIWCDNSEWHPHEYTLRGETFAWRNFRVFAFSGHFRETKSPRKELTSRIAKVYHTRNVLFAGKSKVLTLKWAQTRKTQQKESFWRYVGVNHESLFYAKRMLQAIRENKSLKFRIFFSRDNFSP